MDQTLITRIIEAALLASQQPLTLAQLNELFPEDEPAPPGSVARALQLLREGCAERGVELVEVASGFRFQVKADVHGWVARLWTERKTRYTRATLETLALIAYRQPITRGEIEQVRGVTVSSNIIQALEEREWIRVVGHRDVPGRPTLFGTTKGFLDYFGLKSLDQLPPLSELKDIGELDPQLPLDTNGQPAAPLPASAAAAGLAAQAVPGASGQVSMAQADARLTEDNPDGSGPVVTVQPDNDAPEPTPDASAPEAAPGERAVDPNEDEDNAVATTTVAVDEADPEPEAAPERADRSQNHE